MAWHGLPHVCCWHGNLGADLATEATAVVQTAQVCNHPDMLRQKGDDAAAEAEPLDDLFPADHVAGAPADSGAFDCHD